METSNFFLEMPNFTTLNITVPNHLFPVSTQRCFDVHVVSITFKKRWILDDVQITSYVNRVLKRNKEIKEYNSKFWGLDRNQVQKCWNIFSNFSELKIKRALYIVHRDFTAICQENKSSRKLIPLRYHINIILNSKIFWNVFEYRHMYVI